MSLFCDLASNGTRNDGAYIQYININRNKKYKLKDVAK